MAVPRPRERDLMPLEEIEKRLQPMASHLERIRYLDGVLGRMREHYFRLSKKAGSDEEIRRAQPSMKTRQFKSGLQTLRFRIIRRMVESMLSLGIRERQLADRGHPVHEQYRIAMAYYKLGSFSREDLLKAAELSRIYGAAASRLPQKDWKLRARRALGVSGRFSRRARDEANRQIASLAVRGIRAE